MLTVPHSLVTVPLPPSLEETPSLRHCQPSPQVTSLTPPLPPSLPLLRDFSSAALRDVAGTTAVPRLHAAPASRRAPHIHPPPPYIIIAILGRSSSLQHSSHLRGPGSFVTDIDTCCRRHLAPDCPADGLAPGWDIPLESVFIWPG